MSINWTIVKSVSWITMAVSAVLLLIKVILAAFGISFEIESISNVVNIILGILASVGLISGTTASATVSTQAKIEDAVKNFKMDK